MFDLDTWREIWNSMRRHKLRTFLTALSVWWGIFMLVILMGAGNGLQNSFERNFRDDAINSLWIYQGRTSKPYQGLPVGRNIRFDNSDFDLLREEIPGVEHLSGRYYLSGEYTVKYGQEALSFDVRSVHPGHRFLENTQVIIGRYINEADISQTRKVCVIGEEVRKSFFPQPGQAVIGEQLEVKGVLYRIVGVFTDEGGETEQQKIYIPISTAQRIYAGDDRVHQLMLTVGDADLEASRAIAGTIRSQMAVRHRFDPEDEQAIRIWNNIEGYQEFNTVFGFIKGFIWFVGIGSIIAGVIGVSNIMLIVVKDRTREIGVRKAMGATPGSIIRMILQESIVLTSVAGYVGLLSGFGLIYGLRNFMVANDIEVEFFYNPEVDFLTVLLALLILVICGALAGLIPARQAARVNPVIAMRA
jgi:putative ABC transport system permease protein